MILEKALAECCVMACYSAFFSNFVIRACFVWSVKSVPVSIQIICFMRLQASIVGFVTWLGVWGRVIYEYFHSKKIGGSFFLREEVQIINVFIFLWSIAFCTRPKHVFSIEYYNRVYYKRCAAGIFSSHKGYNSQKT